MSNATKINLQTVVRRNPQMVTAEVDGMMVMMSVEEGQYFGLNKVGSYIWELMAEPVAVGKLIDQLLEKFDVSREVCETEVLAYLDLVKTNGLLEIREPAAANE